MYKTVILFSSDKQLVVVNVQCDMDPDNNTILALKITYLTYYNIILQSQSKGDNTQWKNT